MTKTVEVEFKCPNCGHEPKVENIEQGIRNRYMRCGQCGKGTFLNVWMTLLRIVNAAG